jgi:hypothetical protein
LLLTLLAGLQITLMGFQQNPLPQLVDASGLAALIVAPIAFFFGRRTKHSRRFFGLIVLFLVCLAISTAVTGNPYAPKIEAFGLDLLVDGKVYALALVLFAFLPGARLERCFHATLWLMLITGLINLPFIFHDLVSSQSVHEIPLQVRSGIHVPVGLFELKVMSVEVQLLATISAMALYHEPRWKHLLFWRPLIGVLVFSVIVHISSKELIALAAVMVIFTTLRRGRHLGLTAFATLALLIVFLMVSTIDTPIRSAFLDRVNTFFGQAAGQTVRTAAYLGSFKLSSEYFPFGTGASTFMSKGARDLAYSPFYAKTGIAYLWGGTPNNPIFIMDTFWPKILGQSGWVGFLAYASATLSMAWWSLRLYRREGTGVAFAATGIICTVLICSFATPAYTHDHLILPLSISFAFVLAARPRRRAGMVGPGVRRQIEARSARPHMPA